MKQYIIKVMLIGISIIVMECGYSDSDLIGVYVKYPSENTIDSLFVFSDSTYTQKVFYKSGELYGTTSNKWKLWDNRIDFRGLYSNYDKELGYHAEPINHKLRTSSASGSLLPIEGSRIYINYDMPVYYQKIK